MRVKTGDRIKHYSIKEIIGHGSFATVFNATDGTEDLAFKVYHEVTSMASDDQRQIEKEYELGASLKHEHILPPLDFGVYNNSYYMVMPKCDGSLLDLVEKASGDFGGINFSEVEIAELIVQVSDALAYLEGNKVRHQDLKPGNILYNSIEGKRHYWLTDFGESTQLRNTVRTQRFEANKEKSLGFAPAYAAPEMFHGNVTYAGDIFSLGVTIFEMMTGAPPYIESPFGLGQVLNHGGEVPAMPSSYTNGLCDIVASCLVKSPTSRPKAQELYHSAQYYLNTGYWPGTQHMDVLANPTDVNALKKNSKLRLRLVLGSIVTLIGVVAAFYFLMLQPNNPETHQDGNDQINLEDKYQRVTSVGEDVLIYQDDSNLWGSIDISGKHILPAAYEFIDFLGNGVFEVRMPGEQINKTINVKNKTN